MLMVSMGLAAGLNPNFRVYVFASPKTCDEIKTMIQESSLNVEVVTAQEEFNELPTLARIRCINTVIVGDDAQVSLPPIPTLFEALWHVPNIGILKEFEGEGVAQNVKNTFSERVEIISMENLPDYLQAKLLWYKSLVLRQSLLPWALPYSTYSLIVKGVAALSLLLILLQASLCSHLAAISTKVEDLYNIILISVAAFIFSQIIYMTCSSIIGLPLGLHTTGAGVAAISLIGPFGGGTYPRVAFGVLGVIIGVGSAAAVAKMKFSKWDFIAILPVGVIISIMFFYFGRSLLIMPRILGLHFHSEFLGIGTITAFYVSRSIITFFGGIIAMYGILQMQRYLRAFSFLLCVVLVGYGGSAVGDMLPYHTYISTVPGILLGLGLIALFAVLNIVERYVKGLVSARQSYFHK